MIPSILLLCVLLFAWYVGFWVVQNDGKERAAHKGLLAQAEARTKAPAQGGRRAPRRGVQAAADGSPAEPDAPAARGEPGTTDEARRFSRYRPRPTRGA